MISVRTVIELIVTFAQKTHIPGPQNILGRPYTILRVLRFVYGRHYSYLL